MIKTAKPVVALVVLGLALAGCAGQNYGPKQGFGTLAGAAAGGLLGAQVGGGSGRLVSTAVGTLAGAAIGNSIGDSLDKADQLYAKRAQNHALEHTRTGHITQWQNPDSNLSRRRPPLSGIPAHRDRRRPNAGSLRASVPSSRRPLDYRLIAIRQFWEHQHDSVFDIRFAAADRRTRLHAAGGRAPTARRCCHGLRGSFHCRARSIISDALFPCGPCAPWISAWRAIPFSEPFYASSEDPDLSASVLRTKALRPAPARRQCKAF